MLDREVAADGEEVPLDALGADLAVVHHRPRLELAALVDVGVDGWRLGQRYSKHLCLPICRFIPWEIELAQIQIETPKECTHVNMRTKQHRIRSRAKLATDPRPLTG